MTISEAIFLSCSASQIICTWNANATDRGPLHFCSINIRSHSYSHNHIQKALSYTHCPFQHTINICHRHRHRCPPPSCYLLLLSPMLLFFHSFLSVFVSIFLFVFICLLLFLSSIPTIWPIKRLKNKCRRILHSHIHTLNSQHARKSSFICIHVLQYAFNASVLLLFHFYHGFHLANKCALSVTHYFQVWDTQRERVSEWVMYLEKVRSLQFIESFILAILSFPDFVDATKKLWSESQKRIKLIQSFSLVSWVSCAYSTQKAQHPI